ncbi:MAG: serine hydrolase [Acidobacteria bacterium]|nr:serine hydrolase [Acidobacteriota bacterium]
MKIIYAAWLLLFQCALLSAQTPDIAKSERVDALFTSLAQNNSPGYAVIIIQNGKVLHRKGYGLANLETKTPIMPETVFDLGSIGKQFTAIAIMMLAERGKLNYDDALSKFFPQFPLYAQKITIRHLLNHTAGLTEYDQLFIQSGKVDRDYESSFGQKDWLFEPTSKDTLNLLAKQKMLRFAPGDEWEYSNSGYVALGQIIEKVSAKSCPQFLKENIFEPLEMKNTLVYDETKPKIPNLAVSYMQAGNELKGINTNALNLQYGDGGINSSVDDLAKWYKALDENRLVKSATLKKALTSGESNNGANIGYGFGWYVGKSLGLERMIHAGTWMGFRNQVVYYPKEHFVALVLSNHGRLTRTDRSAIITKLAKIYLSDKMIFPAAVQLAPEILQKYAGKYESESGQILNVVLEHNSLTVKNPNLLPIKLVPEAEAKFFVEGSEDDRYVFRTDETGKVTGVTAQLSLAGYTKFAYSSARKLP